MSSISLPDKTLSREEAVNLLLTSIAMQEISLSNILNAEAERMKTLGNESLSVENALQINSSIDSTIRTVIQKEMILLLKLESILRIPQEQKNN